MKTALVCLTTWLIVTEILIGNYLALQVQRDALDEARAARKVIEQFNRAGSQETANL